MSLVNGDVFVDDLEGSYVCNGLKNVDNGLDLTRFFLINLLVVGFS
jgi:hypothetical protein